MGLVEGAVVLKGEAIVHTRWLESVLLDRKGRDSG